MTRCSIDAANEHERLLELCRDLGVRRVVETHGHWDHIQAVEAVRDAGYDVAVTQADAEMLPAYDQILEDEAVLEVGRLRIATIATPGHTPGSMCFAVEGTPLLFTGDTLFPGGPGNTSFENADFATIIPSIEGRLFGAVRRRHPGPARATATAPRSGPSPPPRGVGRPGLVTARAGSRTGPPGPAAQTAVEGRRGSRMTSISGGRPLTDTPPATSAPTSMVTRDPASGIPSTLR